MTSFWKISREFAFCVFAFCLHFSPGLASIQWSTNADELGIIIRRDESVLLICTGRGTKAEIDAVTGKVKWLQPTFDNSDHTEVTDGIINTTKADGGNTINTTLLIPRFPDFAVPGPLYYICRIGYQSQHFPFLYVRGKAEPKVEKFNKAIIFGTYGENIKLLCKVSYDGNLASIFGITLSWMHNRHLKKQEKPTYTNGKNSIQFDYIVKIDSSKDGGNYACKSTLFYRKNPWHSISNSQSLELYIKPYIIGEQIKEVKKTAGSDVDLVCDIVGYPVTYSWVYVGARNGSDPRITIKGNVLSIKDIDYKDRKEYVCVASIGVAANRTEMRQIIILRVKESPPSLLWPIVGSVVAVTAVVIIISVTVYCKKRRRQEAEHRIEHDGREHEDAGPHQSLFT